MTRINVPIFSQWLKRRQFLWFSGLGLAALSNRLTAQSSNPNPTVDNETNSPQNVSNQYANPYQWTPQNLLPNTQWQIMTVVNPTRMVTASGNKVIPPIIITGNTTTPEMNQNWVTVYCQDTSTLRVGDLLEFQPPADAKLRTSFSPFDPNIWVSVEKIISKTSFLIGIPHTCYDEKGNKFVSSNASNAYIMTRGDTDGTAVEKDVGRGPDRWWRTPQLSFWRDTWADNAKAGSRYSLGIRKTSDASQFLWCESNNSNLHLYEDVEKLRGRQIVFGAWVNHKIKQGSGIWKLFINQYDAQGNLLKSALSSPSKTTGYQWQEVTKMISIKAVKVQVGVEFWGDNNDVYYLSQPMLAYGNYLGEGNYRQLENELLTGSNNTVPGTFFSANVHFPKNLDGASGPGYYSYGFPLRLYAETNGKIAPTVKKIILQMEGRCNTIDRAFFLRNQELGPHIYGLGVYSKVPAMMETCAGAVTLWNGNLYVYAGNSPENNNWYGVSFDINSYVL